MATSRKRIHNNTVLGKTMRLGREGGGGGGNSPKGSHCRAAQGGMVGVHNSDWKKLLLKSIRGRPSRKFLCFHNLVVLRSLANRPSRGDAAAGWWRYGGVRKKLGSPEKALFYWTFYVLFLHCAANCLCFGNFFSRLSLLFVIIVACWWATLSCYLEMVKARFFRSPQPTAPGWMDERGGRDSIHQ